MSKRNENPKIHKVSDNDILLLLDKKSDELISTLSRTAFGLENYLSELATNLNNMNMNLLDNILQILKEACCYQSPRHMGLLKKCLRMLMDCQSFLFVMIPFAISTCFERKPRGLNLLLFVTNYIVILHKILKYYYCSKIIDDVFPQIQNYMNRLNETRSTSSDIFKEFSVLKAAVEKHQRDSSASDDDADEAETWRHLSIVPRYNDLLNCELPNVPMNITDRPYKSVGHYLGVHFRLLREDMIRNFRDVVETCMDRNFTGGKQSEFNLYESVSIEFPPKYTPQGIVYKIKLMSPKKVNWESKAVLTSGSLLCLTPDSFHSVVFASVYSDLKALGSNIREASLKIKLEDDTFLDELSDRPYQIVEPKAYFESYKHVLSALKGFSEGNFPLSDIITYLDFENPEPEYLMESAETKFCLHECCEKEIENESHPCKEFNPLKYSDWPSAEELKLDQQQFGAFQTALTNKVAVIQGPPGTGKTFIGVKIVKALLDNVPHKPIVISCMTNHALDQFLERILEHTKKVVRLGGQSQSVILQPYLLRSYEMAVRKYHECNGAYEITDELIKKSLSLLEQFCPLVLQSKATPGNGDYKFLELKHLCNALQEDAQVLRMSKEKYLDETSLNYIIPSKHKEQLCKGSASHSGILSAKLMEWLCESNSKVLYEKCQKYFSKLPLKSNSSCASSAEELWNLTLSDRFRLFYTWRQDCLRVLEKRMADDLESYKEMMMTFEQDSGRDPMIMMSSDIIGVTTTGASKYKDLIKLCYPRILIIEEAAEVLEAHVISALLPSIEHLILIGDHKQLRPLSADHDLSENYKLTISMFERLFENSERIFDNTERVFENKAPLATLVTQHRMKPCIAELLTPTIYQELKSYKNVYAYEDIRGIEHSMYFLSHSELEDTNSSGKSCSNQYECKLVVSLAKYFLAQCYSREKITILATYAAQVILIAKELECQKLEIKVTTVDNYQGEENDILLISFVRSNPSAIGFLKESNRVCVALSRAKMGMFCIGNFKLFSRRSPLWEDILGKVESSGMTGDTIPLQCSRHKVAKHVQSPEKILAFLDDGCSKRCGYKLPCGHECLESCHFYDPEHLKYYCKMPCEKYIDKDRICPRLCYQPCKRGKKHVFKLPCGHLASALDSNASFENVKCLQEQQKCLPCGHIATLPCYVNASEHQCEKLVTVNLPCGHLKQALCSTKDTSHHVCFESEQKTGPCGHIIIVPCGINLRDYEMLAFCDKRCDTLLQCGHECMSYCRFCFDTGIHGLCSLNCENRLSCGHNCPRPCGSPCGSCDENCFMSCAHNEHCINKCLRPCVKCEKKCARICKHLKCDKLCFEDCSVDPCVRPCDRILPCGHVCCGLCGDPCPFLCRICHRSDFESGDPDIDQYVMLHDCEHVIEVDILTAHIRECLSLLQWPSCPNCSSVIKRNLRFKSELKQAKMFCLGSNDVEKEVEELKYYFCSMYGKKHFVPARFKDIDEKISVTLCRQDLAIDTVLILKTCISCLGELVKMNKLYDELPVQKRDQFDTLLIWIFHHLTQASFEQLSAVENATSMLRRDLKISEDLDNSGNVRNLPKTCERQSTKKKKSRSSSRGLPNKGSSPQFFN